MAALPSVTTSKLDCSVTEEKVVDAVRRIVEATHPLQIIAFGSRARGDHRPNSDLDLAVILDSEEPHVSPNEAYRAVQAVDMSIDIIAASKSHYDTMRPWLNSVYNYIDKEGVLLYDRDHPEQASPHALYDRNGRRGGSDLCAS